ncbi:formimidoylglutamase [Pedobacter sp. AW31-3R]|uniref:formimidoylglutamase n=1 Tax=Pedobacter sp. AW31-3R TaxID=3445781 RepID=UPI003FA127BC
MKDTHHTTHFAFMNINPLFYRKTAEDVWNGRNDGNENNVQRWHQRIILIDLFKQDLPDLEHKKGIALIGFSCDEGVKRNGGRVGAKEGPFYIRKACGSLPVHFEESLVFVDLGDIICPDHDMEEAQQALSVMVKYALMSGYQPLVIGGGHEIAYGHYNGIKNYLAPSAPIGIINFDAHFDMRESNENGYNSGTGFLQIANDCQQENIKFRYLPIGIQKNSNTKQLFDKADDLGVNYITAGQFMPHEQTELLHKIHTFIAESSAIYLTICMDVFSSSVAPGVSAVAYNGLFPDPFFFHCLQVILESGKVISSDIAECNPKYDQNNATSKLAAALAFKMISP